jgi:hypothetical protein
VKKKYLQKAGLWLAIVVITALSGIHCGGEYKPPQGVATAGTATAPQSFGSKPQMGVPLDALKLGDMVWAMRKDGCYYPAQITKLINERYYVRYADGQRGRLKLEKLARWRLSPGMAVEVMSAEDEWQKAVINAVSGENMAVQIGNNNSLKVVSLKVVRVRSFPPS